MYGFRAIWMDGRRRALGYSGERALHASGSESRRGLYSDLYVGVRAVCFAKDTDVAMQPEPELEPKLELAYRRNGRRHTQLCNIV